MKICLVVNAFPNVSETFIFNKVVSLAAKGHIVHVVCSKSKVGKDTFSKYELGSANLKIHVIAIPRSLLSFMNSLIYTPLIFFKSFSLNKEKSRDNYVFNYYLNFFNKIDYDIIHFEFSGLGANFLPIIDKLKGKKVVSCRGTGEKVKLLINDGRKDDLTKLFQKVDLIHCVSNDMKKTITPFCSNTAKIFVNTPAIDTVFFSSNKSKERGEVVQIFSVGRLNFQKNYLTGLLALKILANKGYQFHWKIVGEGSQLEELQFHVFSLSLQEHVTFLGKQNKDEIKLLHEAADIFLLTSVYEGIPNVVLEAMSMQVPVVTTRCGGVDEVIDHGIDGFIAELYDHAAIAKYIETLVNDVELRKTIGAAARKKVQAQFTLEKQTAIFEKQYRLLL